VISASSRWLLIPVAVALSALCLCRTVRAQTLTVALSSSGDQTLTAGSSFSNGGTVTVTASGVPSGATVNVTSVTLSVENAALFDSLSLAGSSPAGSENFSLPLTSGSNDATFSSIQLSEGQSASFVLSGTVSSTSPATSNFALRQVKNFRPASMLRLGVAGGTSMVAIGLIMLLLAIGGKLRRRHLVMLALWMVMGAVALGCGQAGGASSDQQVTALTATSSTGSTVNITGVPTDLGMISVSVAISSGGVALPTPTP
jgi:hypothetical protein